MYQRLSGSQAFHWWLSVPHCLPSKDTGKSTGPHFPMSHPFVPLHSCVFPASTARGYSPPLVNIASSDTLCHHGKCNLTSALSSEIHNPFSPFSFWLHHRKQTSYIFTGVYLLSSCMTILSSSFILGLYGYSSKIGSLHSNIVQTSWIFHPTQLERPISNTLSRNIVYSMLCCLLWELSKLRMKGHNTFFLKRILSPIIHCQRRQSFILISSLKFSLIPNSSRICKHGQEDS